MSVIVVKDSNISSPIDDRHDQGLQLITVFLIQTLMALGTCTNHRDPLSGDNETDLNARTGVSAQLDRRRVEVNCYGITVGKTLNGDDNRHTPRARDT